MNCFVGRNAPTRECVPGDIEVKGLRTQNHEALEDQEWAIWLGYLEAIKENLLSPQQSATPAVSPPVTIAEVAEPTIAAAAS